MGSESIESYAFIGRSGRLHRRLVLDHPAIGIFDEAVDAAFRSWPPLDLLAGIHPDLVKRFRRRTAIESAWELRRHPGRIRLPLLGFYCVPHAAGIVDERVDLLVQVTHRITVEAERWVVTEALEKVKAVRGKTRILFEVCP